MRQNGRSCGVAYLVLILLGTARPTPAQTIGTQCWNSGGVVRCNSQVGLLYVPTTAETLADAYRNLAPAIQQYFINRNAQRRAEAARVAEAQQQQAQAAEAQAREAAAQRLFVQRASAVITVLGDSLRLYGEAAARFTQAIQPSLLDLYRVTPGASAAEIREALWPHVVTLNKQFEDFLLRVVPPSRPSIDSLGLSQAELGVFTQALLPLSQDVFMRDPDLDPLQYRTSIQPLLERARVYFDSTRRASPNPPGAMPRV